MPGHDKITGIWIVEETMTLSASVGTQSKGTVYDDMLCRCAFETASTARRSTSLSVFKDMLDVVERCVQVDVKLARTLREVVVDVVRQATKCMNQDCLMK
jgi:hypothetical protein